MVSPARVLATRCPHCQTIFRVVADQLKLREGLVRCGRCREVFDGRTTLMELTMPAPGAVTPVAEAATPVVAPAAPVAGRTDDAPAATIDRDPATASLAPTSQAAASTIVDDTPPSASASPADVVPSTSPSGAPLSTDTARAPAAADAADVDSATAPESILPPPLPGASHEEAKPTGGKPAPPVLVQRTPDMLTPAAFAALLGIADESRAEMHWKPGRYIDDTDDGAPRHKTHTSAFSHGLPPPAYTAQDAARELRQLRLRRALWGVAMVLAVIGVAGQWAWLERAALIDRWPSLHGVFAAIGKPAHAHVLPARAPDMLSLATVTLVADGNADADGTASANADGNAMASAVVASDATAAPPAPDAVPMTLTIFIRNRAAHAVAWPSLELTLSDVDAKPVVRRVFAATDYLGDAGLRDAGLPPHSERTIRLRLTAQAALASNYRVLAFYP